MTQPLFQFKLGSTTLSRLSTCDLSIQRWLQEAIKTSPIDFTIPRHGGYRPPESGIQAELVATGVSHVEFGDHNYLPSRAVDVIPYPVRWPEHQPDELGRQIARARFLILYEHLRDVAQDLGLVLGWGGDWDGDGNMREHHFSDLGHWWVKDV